MGRDLISLNTREDESISINHSTGRVRGAGSDTVVSVEDAQADGGPSVIIGNAARNHLEGGALDGHIEGRGGDDFLDGAFGTDLLDGGKGNEKCIDGDTLLNCEA